MQLLTTTPVNPALFCNTVKEAVKHAYHIIVYSDNCWEADTREREITRRLAQHHHVLFIEGRSCAGKNTRKYPVLSKEGNLHIMHFEELDKQELWSALPHFVSTYSLPAFVFFSPTYSLLKTMPCNKVVYIPNGPLTNEKDENYLLGEADVVLDKHDEHTAEKIISLMNSSK